MTGPILIGIGYAYPTSDYARKMGRYRQGCYFVAGLTEESVVPRVLTGAIDKLAQAEEIAAGMIAADPKRLEWDWAYMRHPFPGSRFVNGAAA